MRSPRRDIVECLVSGEGFFFFSTLDESPAVNSHLASVSVWATGEHLTQMPLNAALSGGVVLKGPRRCVLLEHATALEFHREEPSGRERCTAVAVEVVAHGHISRRNKQA